MFQRQLGNGGTETWASKCGGRGERSRLSKVVGTSKDVHHLRLMVLPHELLREKGNRGLRMAKVTSKRWGNTRSARRESCAIVSHLEQAELCQSPRIRRCADGLFVLLVHHEVGALSRLVGKLVASFVLNVTRMTTHPLERDIVTGGRVK